MAGDKFICEKPGKKTKFPIKSETETGSVKKGKSILKIENEIIENEIKTLNEELLSNDWNEILNGRYWAGL